MGKYGKLSLNYLGYSSLSGALAYVSNIFLRYMGTPSCFSAIFIKGHNCSDFLNASMDKEVLLKEVKLFLRK